MPIETASAKRKKLTEDRLNTLQVINRLDALKKKRNESVVRKRNEDKKQSANAHLLSRAPIDRVYQISDPDGINNDFIEVQPIEKWTSHRRTDTQHWLNTTGTSEPAVSQTVNMDDGIAYQKLMNSVCLLFSTLFDTSC